MSFEEERIVHEIHPSLTHMCFLWSECIFLRVPPLHVQDGRQQRRTEREINKRLLLLPLGPELVNETWLLGYCYIQGMGKTVNSGQNSLVESHFKELNGRSGSLQASV